MKTAIMIDGAFYLMRASKLFGAKAPKERANEVMEYCYRHIKKQESTLYRIFFYDCPPSDKNVYHPLKKQSISLLKTPQYAWASQFHEALLSKRKLAFRHGELLESAAGFLLRPDALKALCNGTKEVADLTEGDFYLDIKQKGVDMRIGLDIASVANKKQVDQIILIAGDSDFVPAAKHARREGIDVVLDPMWHTIKPSLNEHVDGIISCVSKPPDNTKDPLCRLPVLP